LAFRRLLAETHLQIHNGSLGEQALSYPFGGLDRDVLVHIGGDAEDSQISDEIPSVVADVSSQHH
jgi:hypothetical protein